MIGLLTLLTLEWGNLLLIILTCWGQRRITWQRARRWDSRMIHHPLEYPQLGPPLNLWHKYAPYTNKSTEFSIKNCAQSKLEKIERDSELLLCWIAALLERERERVRERGSRNERKGGAKGTWPSATVGRTKGRQGTTDEREHVQNARRKAKLTR